METAGSISKWGKFLVIVIGFTNASRLVLLERAYAYFCTLLQCFTPLLKYHPPCLPKTSQACSQTFQIECPLSIKLEHRFSFLSFEAINSTMQVALHSRKPLRRSVSSNNIILDLHYLFHSNEYGH